MLSDRLLKAASGAVGYQTGAVRFDGTNDYMLRGADLTGNANGKEFTFSTWLDFQGGDGVSQSIFAAFISSLGYQIWKRGSSPANVLRLFATNTGATTILGQNSTTAYTASGGWIHLLAAVNLATTTAQLYVTDSDDTAGGATITNDTIDFTRPDHAMGAETTGSQKLFADVADLWFAQEYVDISVEANRRKFIDAAGKPVDLGSDGSTPTGTAPIVFFKHTTGAAATDWATNLGTGGNYSITGALTEAPTSPSD